MLEGVVIFIWLDFFGCIWFFVLVFYVVCIEALAISYGYAFWTYPAGVKKGAGPIKKGLPPGSPCPPQGGWRFSGSSRASCRHLHAAISGVPAPREFQPNKKDRLFI